jgi:hypothetical protein
MPVEEDMPASFTDYNPTDNLKRAGRVRPPSPPKSFIQDVASRREKEIKK